MKISFGDQEVSLLQVRKVVLNKQNYIELGDGTIGILPEEWLEKYAALFRIGEIKDNHLKVSQRLFSIIETLYHDIDNIQV